MNFVKIWSVNTEVEWQLTLQMLLLTLSIISKCIAAIGLAGSVPHLISTTRYWCWRATLSIALSIKMKHSSWVSWLLSFCLCEMTLKRKIIEWNMIWSIVFLLQISSTTGAFDAASFQVRFWVHVLQRSQRPGEHHANFSVTVNIPM